MNREALGSRVEEVLAEPVACLSNVCAAEVVDIYDGEFVFSILADQCRGQVIDEWYPLGSARDEDHHSTVPRVSLQIMNDFLRTLIS